MSLLTLRCGYLRAVFYLAGAGPDVAVLMQGKEHLSLYEQDFSNSARTYSVRVNIDASRQCLRGNEVRANHDFIFIDPGDP